MPVGFQFAAHIPAKVCPVAHDTQSQPASLSESILIEDPGVAVLHPTLLHAPAGDCQKIVVTRILNMMDQAYRSLEIIQV